MKFRKLTKFEKLALIPIVGAYWVIKHNLESFSQYQLFFYMLFGVLIGKLF